MARLIIFFDGECPLCHRAVRFLLSQDRRAQFFYAPLQGQTASKLLGEHPPLDTLVLLEGDRQFRYGKGALRICWHLGGLWRLLGWLSFLPGWFINPAYRLVARNRHLFVGRGTPEVSPPTERFLP